MISRKLKRGGKPKTSICPSKKNMQACEDEASCKWNAVRSKCRKSRVAKKKWGNCDYCGGPLEDKIDLNIIDLVDGSTAVLCYKCFYDEDKIDFITENGPKKKKNSASCPKKNQIDCQADPACVWNNSREKCRKKTIRAIPSRLYCKDLNSKENCDMDPECLWNKKEKCQRRPVRKAKISRSRQNVAQCKCNCQECLDKNCCCIKTFSNDCHCNCKECDRNCRVSPPRVSPARVSPRVSPARVSPRVSPARVSPPRVSPARVSPPKQAVEVDPITLLLNPEPILMDCDFGNLANYSREISAIGEVSGHGFIRKMKYTSPSYKVDVVAKCSLDKYSDSIVYEYLAGQCVNHFAQFYPCFSRTFNICKFNTKKDLKKLKDVSATKTLSTGLHEMMSGLDASDLDNLLKTGCSEKDLMCIFTQYFNFDCSLKTCVESGMNTSTLLSILYLVYSCLSSLSPQFTHYDLHAQNVQLVKIPNDGYSLLRVHLADGRTVPFKTNYLPVIIDYGRCFVNCAALNSNDIAKRVCHFDSKNPNKVDRVCKKTCGDESGYDLPDYNKKTQVFEEQKRDTSDISRTNISADLRLLNDIKFSKNFSLPNDYCGKNLSELLKIITLPIHRYYVLREDTSMDPSRVANIMTAKNALLTMINNPRFVQENNANFSSHRQYNTIDIWEDLSRPFEVTG
jgi:hypothetical protein